MMIDDCAPDNISGEHEEDTPHAREQGGRDKGEEDQPVPEAELPHTGEDGVIVTSDLYWAHHWAPGVLLSTDGYTLLLWQRYLLAHVCNTVYFLITIMLTERVSHGFPSWFLLSSVHAFNVQVQILDKLSEIDNIIQSVHQLLIRQCSCPSY